MENRFVSAESAIESFRDNGFSNTAYALAELIDNSIQAKASRVEVSFIERVTKVVQRERRTVEEICIFDNGTGMSPRLLSEALSFGKGDNRKDRDGMGKFGMGLPNSSISQCKKLEVWSWTKNAKPHYTYLDVDLMKMGRLELVPEPVQQELPNRFQQIIGDTLPESGTLVVWSNLDRVIWKTGKSIHRHCEQIIGRLYRKFIASEKVRIESGIYVRDGDDSVAKLEKMEFRANDPMYLTRKSSLPTLPGDHANETFFQLESEETVPVKYSEEDGSDASANVIIRTSIVKKSIASAILKNSTVKLGQTEWGKHCAKNIGVSIVRAGRELVLRKGFFSSDIAEYKARFLGVEIEFPPQLDSVFGVTNNKQDAVALVAYEDLDQLALQNGFDSKQEYVRDLKENEDPLAQVINVIDCLKLQIKALEKKLDGISVEPRAVLVTSDSASESAAAKATIGSINREKQGHRASGFNEPFNKDELSNFLKTELDIETSEATATADSLMLSGSKFYITSRNLDSNAFFDVSTQKLLTLVIFNERHVFFRDFISKLQKKELEILETAIAGFARVMNETDDPARSRFLDVVRREWGAVITDFLDDSSDSFE